MRTAPSNFIVLTTVIPNLLLTTIHFGSLEHFDDLFDLSSVFSIGLDLLLGLLGAVHTVDDAVDLLDESLAVVLDGVELVWSLCENCLQLLLVEEVIEELGLLSGLWWPSLSNSAV